MIFLFDNITTIPFKLCHDSMPLAELCEELKTMAGHNVLEALDLCVKIGQTMSLDLSFNIRLRGQKLFALMPEVKGEHCSIEHVIISTGESHLLKLQSVAFNYSVSVVDCGAYSSSNMLMARGMCIPR
jgi:hypothetical protein